LRNQGEGREASAVAARNGTGADKLSWCNLGYIPPTFPLSKQDFAFFVVMNNHENDEGRSGFCSSSFVILLGIVSRV